MASNVGDEYSLKRFSLVLELGTYQNAGQMIIEGPTRLLHGIMIRR